MFSLGGGTTLDRKPNSNLPIFSPKPWELDIDFHVKTHLVVFYKKKPSSFGFPSRVSHGSPNFHVKTHPVLKNKNKNPVLVLLLSQFSHGSPNQFSALFSSKVRIVGFQCENQTENRVTGPVRTAQHWFIPNIQIEKNLNIVYLLPGFIRGLLFLFWGRHPLIRSGPSFVFKSLT